MKKSFLERSSLFRGLLSLVLLLAMAGNAWGADEVYKTALFGSSYNSKGVSSYTGSFSATNNEFTVNLSNFNNNNNGWSYVKTGNKTAAAVGTIITNAAIDKAITKVVVTIDAVTATSVNSIKLYSGTSSSSITTEEGSFTVEAGTQTVTISSPTANKFYKIAFDCKKGSSNGLVTVSKVEFYYNNGGGSTPTALSEPNNLSSSNVTANSATLSWDAVDHASSYTLKIGETEYANATSPYSATGLKAETEYTWTVKAIGDGTNYSSSDYAESKTFTTAEEQGSSNENSITINVSKLTNPFTGTAITYGTYDWADGTISGVYNGASSSSNTSLQFNYSSDGISNYRNRQAVYNTVAIPGRITSIKMTTASGTNRSWTAYVGTSELSPDNYSKATSLGAKTVTTIGTTWTINSSSDDYSYFYLYYGTGSASYIGDIVIEYEPTVEKTLQSIAVSGTPTKTTYYDGDNFNTDGLSVTGTYGDGSTKTITTGITWTVTPNPLTTGTTSVSVTAKVGEITSATYTVNGLTVNAVEVSSIAIKTAPKTDYIVGDTFNPAGLVITVSKNNSTEEEVAYSETNASDFTFVPSLTTALKKDDNKVTITYGGKSIDQDITVRAKHRVTFSINGNTSSYEDVIEGEAIHFPSNPTVDDDEYSFVGWIEEAITGNTDNTPTYVNASITMGNSDVTYYAAFARQRPGSEFTLVTGENEISAGAQILIVSTENNRVASSFMPNQNCLDYATVTINNSKITDKGNGTVFTIGGSTGQWTLSCNEGTLACYGTANNNLSMSGDCSTWVITIASNGNATIKNTQHTSRLIKYNTSSPRFSTYALSTSGTSMPQIYKGSIEYYSYCTTVVSRVLESIAVKTNPTKMEYKEGEKLNLDGLVLTANYDTGEQIDIYNDYTANPASGTTLTTIGNNTITITYKGETCSLTVVVNEIPSHMAKFYVNGTVSSEKLKEGATITFPADPTIEGFVFRGWATSAIDGVTQTEPTYVKTATMGTGDAEFYAVFATQNGTGGNSYYRVMSANDITEGTYVIRTGNTGGYYVVNNGETTSSVPTIASPAVTDNVMDGTEVTGNMTFTFISTNNEFQIKSTKSTASKQLYLYTTDNNDGVNVSTNQSYSWTFTKNPKGNSDADFSAKQTTFSRYLGLETKTSPRMISNKTQNSGNFGKYGIIELYKLSTTTYSDFWTSLTAVSIIGNMPNCQENGEGWKKPFSLSKVDGEDNKYEGTIDATGWGSNYQFKLIKQYGEQTEWWTRDNCTFDLSTNVEVSNNANTTDGNVGNMNWTHNNAYDSYYVTAEYKTDEDNNNYWHISIYGIRDSWDHIAIVGSFPNNNWNEESPMDLPKVEGETNKFHGTINAATWENGTRYEFKLFNSDFNIHWCSDNSEKPIDFTNASTQNFAEGYSWGTLKWIHNGKYKAYNVDAEYKADADGIHYYWDVTITGVPVEYYLRGTWTNSEWATVDEVKFNEEGILELELAAGTYSFKIWSDKDIWYGNTGTMTEDNCTGWRFDADANCTINATIAGKYVFTLTWDGQTPILSAKYPEYISLNIGTTGYATYYNSTQAYIMPIDCEGKVAYYDSKGNWKFETVYNGGDVVPADEALVLHSDNIGEKKLVCTTTDIEPYHKKDQNDLRGTDAQEQIPNDDNYYYYGFSKGHSGTANADKLGFYWRVEGGAAFVNGAHKAYLMVLKSRFNDNPAKAAGFAIDDLTDGISTIETIESGAIYNLNGQRINSPVRGQIYIMNGRKYIAK